MSERERQSERERETGSLVMISREVSADSLRRLGRNPNLCANNDEAAHDVASVTPWTLTRYPRRNAFTQRLSCLAFLLADVKIKWLTHCDATRVACSTSYAVMQLTKATLA